MVDPLLTFVQRRSRLFAGVFAATGLIALGALAAAPSVHVARASLASEGSYEGPLPLLIAQVTSRTTLLALASQAELPARVGLLGRARGLPDDVAERLRAPDQELIGARHGPGGGIELVSVTTRGTSPEQARAIANLLARRLARLDARLTRSAPTNTTTDATFESPFDDTATAAAERARAQLAAHQARYPLLATLEPALAEHRREAAEIAEVRDAVARIEVRLHGLGEKAARLAEQVEDEAAQAYAADLAARQEAARRRAQAAADRTAGPVATAVERAGPPGDSGTAASGPPGSRLEELEDELRRLLATRTRRHPEVRRVLRLLDLEREQARAPTATPAPPASQALEGALEGAPGPAEPVQDRPAPIREAQGAPEGETVRGERHDPFVLAVADGPAEGGPKAGPAEALAEPPAVWLQRAPSYRLWVEAREREEDARIALDERRRELADREARHLEQEQRLAALNEPQREQLRMQSELVRLERRAELDTRSGHSPTRAHAPLRVVEDARLISSDPALRHAPWALLGAALLALCTALLADARDRSFHRTEEVTQALDVPVLGTIPHLRRGRGR